MYLITEDTSRKEDHIPFAQAAKELKVKGELYYVTSGISEEGAQENLKQVANVELTELPVIMVITPTSSGAIKYRFNGNAKTASKEEII